MPQDKSLQMNQTIETAILQLQQSSTPEQLAHTLTVVRRCMQAGGQWIVAVDLLALALRGGLGIGQDLVRLRLGGASLLV